jgi:tetratricopeptide (TPR) repeat protein
MDETMPQTARDVRRRPWRGALAGVVAVATLLTVVLPRAACGQAADRVVLVNGQAISGTVTAVSPATIDVEDTKGETQKVPVDKLREVQFGSEPQSLRSARAMLLRGRGGDAREEIAKVEPEELADAEPLVLAEAEFVRAAAAGRAVLEAGGDLNAALKSVADYLAKNGKSFHIFQMQELLGDLQARAGKPDDAIASYSLLAKGPASVKVRGSTAKAALLLSQGKVEPALAEYDAAIKLAGTDKDGQPQRQIAELGKAKCLSLGGKHDPAIADVVRIIKEANPEDKEFLSRAYATLGGIYRAVGGKDQDALISYLTVDLVYNGLPDSHAEALFNLGELWERGSNPERSREARQNLKAAYPASQWATKLGNSK